MVSKNFFDVKFKKQVYLKPRKIGVKSMAKDAVHRNSILTLRGNLTLKRITCWILTLDLMDDYLLLKR